MHGSYIARPAMPGLNLPRSSSSRAGVSSTRIAGKVIGNLSRSSRLRGRLSAFLIAGIFLALVFMARRNQDKIQTYVMTSLSAPDNKISGNVRSSDDDNRISTESLLDKPKFHLLIPAKKHSLDLCKVLLSAAVLNYPPPTLVGYGVPDEEEYQEAAAIEDTLLFLEGKEVRDGDLALIVNERTWFQLPAQLLIGRFNDIIYQANSQILAKYGPKKEERAGRTQGPFKEPLFKQKILFGAEKTCSEHSPEDVACTASPPSTLPEDIYGPNTDAQSNSTQIRPKYLYSGTMIGEVSSLRSLYQHAFDSLDSAPEGKGNQYIFSDIFGSQELSRSANLLSQQNALSRYLFGSPSTQSPLSGLSQTELITFYKSIPDFGITLDYSSSLFQILHRSLDDVHFVTSSHPTYINSPSKLASSSFRNAISLQLDLNRTTAPFKLHALPLQGGTADDPFLSLDRLPTGMAWTEVDLATNTVVPGAGVPAALAFPGTKTDNANGHRVSKTKKLMGSWWKRMWFQKYARALLRRYMRSPQGTIAAEAADEGGERWWDLRGGKGGVWTDRGHWLTWNEVCGAYDEAVFDDGKGAFGEEDLVKEAAYNKFGELIANPGEIKVVSPRPTVT